MSEAEVWNQARRRGGRLVVLVVALFACGGGDDPSPTDASAADASVADASVADASVADASVADASVADASAGDAGLMCTDNGDCDAGSYCRAETCGGVGTCQERPELCPAVVAPVCGCDGMTYGNACEAAAAGVGVASEGACPPPSCMTNTDCDAGGYCRAETCGGVGACQERPELCPTVVAPVCGCDGMTYGNACEAAAAAGVGVASEGACPAISI